MWIGGKWVDADSGKTFDVLNPTTEEVLGTVPLGGKSDVDKAVAAARKAFPIWSKKPQTERSDIVAKLGRIMRENIPELIKLETTEHGSPIENASFMANWSSELVEFAAATSRTLMGHQLPATADTLFYILREPVGVCALITPWNAPIMMIAAKLAPALAVGNTCVIKPPSINSLIGLKFAEMLEQLDLPAGTVNIVTGPGGGVGSVLAAHPDVDLINFTGSSETGKIIMSAASSTVKRVVTELGGKNPFIVFEDADVEAASECAVHCLYHNGGQSCASPGRFYVHEKLYDQFAQKVVEKTKRFIVGDPSDPKTAIGPVASGEHKKSVEEYIQSGIDEGATLLYGGRKPVAPLDKGYFVMPAIFTNVTQNMKIAREEIFGPVAVILKFSKEEEAIAYANDSRYGLCASVWTRDTAKGIALANDIQAGTVWVNNHMRLSGETPWGGVKESGVGKESGVFGMLEFTTLKLMGVTLPAPPPAK